MIARFKVESYNDRQQICSTLAESGYPVWVEVLEDYMPTRYLVCVEIEDVEHPQEKKKK